MTVNSLPGLERGSNCVLLLFGSCLGLALGLSQCMLLGPLDQEALCVLDQLVQELSHSNARVHMLRNMSTLEVLSGPWRHCAHVLFACYAYK